MFSFLKNEKKRPPIVLYNTLGRKKEVFKPLTGREVRMYTCGPTVYDYAHVGNLRAYIFADVLRRVLEYRGYEVKQVMNITDFGHLVADSDDGEDKMTLALKRAGMELTLPNMKVIGEKYAQFFFEDLKKLNIETPFVFPRASEHIPEQIAFIQTLMDKGYAYQAEHGVYFDVRKFTKYGVLGGSSSEEYSRIGVSKDKHDPRDFTLWKSDPSMGWDSPWGKGFPGWHIECTAMAIKYLGKSFDIHTGGIDHIAIHHNNEIAQAEATTGKPFVRYWLHGAFISVDGKRIGKSEGNAIRLHALTERNISPLAYRYLILTSHYRQTMNFTWESAMAAQTTLHRALRVFADLKASPDMSEPGTIDTKYRTRFEQAIADDLNTPEALAVMWDLIKDGSVAAPHKRATLLDFDRVFGLGFGSLIGEPKTLHAAIPEADLPKDVQEMVRRRKEAREFGQWEEADTLRREIEAKGFEIEDTKDGSRIRAVETPPPML